MSGLGCCCETAGPASGGVEDRVAEITGGELRRKLARGVPLWLVHAPGPDDFARAHIPGAIAVSDALDLSPLVSPGEALVVYGHGPRCPASHMLLANLTLHRVADTRWLRGGLDEWRRLGGALEPAPAREFREVATASGALVCRGWFPTRRRGCRGW